MTGPAILSDHDLYDRLRDHGLTHEQAVHHIELRRMAEMPVGPEPMGPLATGLQAAGETVAGIPRMVGQIATPLAAELVAWLHNSPEGQAQARKAGADVSQWFGLLDPNRALSDQERALVDASRAENPLSAMLGTVGPIMAGAFAGASKAKSAVTSSLRSAFRKEVQAAMETANLGLPNRPGETLTRIAPNGFEVTGPRATPPVPRAPTIAEIHDRLGAAQPAALDPIAAAVQDARAQFFEEQGFSSADAADMARQGTQVPRAIIEQALRLRSRKWQ